MMSIKQMGPYTITLSNTDKIIFPKEQITKLDLINYYQAIARYMLPLIKNHPLTMHRFPDGIDQEGFYQKDASDYFPPWIKTVPFKTQSNKITNYIICNNKATLIYIANQACITPHIWLSKYNKPYKPDRMIFDLDPSDNNFDTVQQAALILKDILRTYNLDSFIMTTGSRGLHVAVPLQQKQDFALVKAFAQNCAQQVINENPKKFTLELKKEKRESRLFIDTLRNNYGATGVAPYAVRAKHGAPIATPIFWEEVLEKTLTSQKYTIKSIFEKLNLDGDPWKHFKKKEFMVP